jgi:hypothetical protein
MSRSAKLIFLGVFAVLTVMISSGFFLLWTCPPKPPTPPPAPTPVTITITPSPIVLNCGTAVGNPTQAVTIKVRDASGSAVVGVPLTLGFAAPGCGTLDIMSGTSSAALGSRGNLVVTLTGLCDKKPCGTTINVAAGGAYTGTATVKFNVK